MTTCYRRRPDATHRSLEGSVFLARPGSASIQRLNETGSALWRLLAEPLPLAELIGTFRAAFPRQSRARLERQIRGLLDVLVEDAFVEAVDVPVAERPPKRRVRAAGRARTARARP